MFQPGGGRIITDSCEKKPAASQLSKGIALGWAVPVTISAAPEVGLRDGFATVKAVCRPSVLDLAGKSQGGLFQQGIEVVREEGLRQVVPESRLTALLVIRASPEAAHRDSERLRVDLADQLPAIPVRESYVTDQDIKFRI